MSAGLTETHSSSHLAEYRANITRARKAANRRLLSCTSIEDFDLCPTDTSWQCDQANFQNFAQDTGDSFGWVPSFSMTGFAGYDILRALALLVREPLVSASESTREDMLTKFTKGMPGFNKLLEDDAKCAQKLIDQMKNTSNRHIDPILQERAGELLKIAKSTNRDPCSTDAPCALQTADLLQSLNIHSGLNNVESNGDLNFTAAGRWCTMPGPDNAKVLWDKYVQKNGGYFNLGCCADEDQYAVIGIAAWGNSNDDTCYGAHSHYNEEVYWQFSGTGTWRTWDLDKVWQTEDADRSDISATEYPGFRGYLAQHYSWLPHEMEIKKGDHILAVYYWAADVSAGKKIGYQYVPNLGGSCMAERDESITLEQALTVKQTLKKSAHTSQQLNATIDKLNATINSLHKSVEHYQWFLSNLSTDSGGEIPRLCAQAKNQSRVFLSNLHYHTNQTDDIITAAPSNYCENYSTPLFGEWTEEAPAGRWKPLPKYMHTIYTTKELASALQMANKEKSSTIASRMAATAGSG